MALRFNKIGTKYRPQTLAFDFSDCYKDGSRPRFNEVGYFLCMNMGLEEGDVKSVGEHDLRRYFFVRMCNEQRAYEVF